MVIDILVKLLIQRYNLVQCCNILQEFAWSVSSLRLYWGWCSAVDVNTAEQSVSRCSKLKSNWWSQSSRGCSSLVATLSDSSSHDIKSKSIILTITTQSFSLISVKLTELESVTITWFCIRVLNPSARRWGETPVKVKN